MAAGSNPGGDVTLGELWRGLQRLTEAVDGLRAEMSHQIEAQVAARVTVLTDRVARMEKIVYGAAGLVLTAVGVAVLALVVRPGGGS